MEIAVKKNNTALATFLLQALLGCGLITLCSLVKIPFYPVPFTLQTLAIVFLGLTQRPAQAFGSVTAYLLTATLGLPVLSGGMASTLWMFGKCGGYLIAFPFGAYLIAILRIRIHPLIAIVCGEALIFAVGYIWLVPFFGASVAWTQGVLLFLPSDALKGLVAYGLAHVWRKYAA